jgi:hypothetical protein
MLFINELFFVKNKYIYLGYENFKIINFNFNITIKYFIFALIILYLFFFMYIYSKIYKKIQIEINNKFEISEYELNINYSSNSNKINSIAFFYPHFFFDNKFNNFSKYHFYKKSINKKYLSIIKNESISILIKNQIDLAKSHGIYGFAIYFNFNYIKETIFILEKLASKDFYFPFFLIWNNGKVKKLLNNSTRKQLLNKEKLYFISIEELFKNIKKYLILDIYIKINGKPIISINQPSKIPNIHEILTTLRKKAKENNIGEIFIFFPLRKINNDIKYINIFDGTYDFSEMALLKYKNSYYSGIIYKNINFNKICKKYSIYRTSILEMQKYKKNNILEGYTPEKFYLLNKMLLDWINNNFNINNRFLFIKSWNNFKEGNYLEPDEKYGYASINSFSKALFNISYNYKYININNFNENCNIAIQVHIFYEDLINEIIKITNNIPVKFDLYITTISLEKKIKIEEYVKGHSQSNKYEILIVPNRGRDVLPLLVQLKKKVKKYKYFCHIHTKKSKHDTSLGKNWRNYLYQNLLGNKEIITEILFDFENFDKLGFIFPEVYYEIIKKIDNYEHTSFFLHKSNLKYMNLILNKIFPGFKVGDKIYIISIRKYVLG